MGVETENYEIAAKRFENTFHVMGFRDFRSSRSRNTGGAFKGPFKSESSQMTCEAELHGSVTRMVYSILSLMGRLEMCRRWGMQRLHNMTGKYPLPFASILICNHASVRQYWALLYQKIPSPAGNCDRSPEWHEQHRPVQPVSGHSEWSQGERWPLRAACLPAQAVLVKEAAKAENN